MTINGKKMTRLGWFDGLMDPDGLTLLISLLLGANQSMHLCWLCVKCTDAHLCCIYLIFLSIWKLVWIHLQNNVGENLPCGVVFHPRSGVQLVTCFTKVPSRRRRARLRLAHVPERDSGPEHWLHSDLVCHCFILSWLCHYVLLIFFPSSLHLWLVLRWLC